MSLIQGADFPGHWGIDRAGLSAGRSFGSFGAGGTWTSAGIHNAGMYRGWMIVSESILLNLTGQVSCFWDVSVENMYIDQIHVELRRCSLRVSNVFIIRQHHEKK